MLDACDDVGASITDALLPPCDWCRWPDYFPEGFDRLAWGARWSAAVQPPGYNFTYMCAYHRCAYLMVSTRFPHITRIEWQCSDVYPPGRPLLPMHHVLNDVEKSTGTPLNSLVPPLPTKD